MPTKEYMRDYMKSRYHLRRNIWLEYFGNKCAICGITSNLEFDHIEKSTKEFNVGKALSGWSNKRLDTEMKKCQILCHTCHVEKTLKNKEYSKVSIHGTYWMYRKYKCRCDSCIKANSGQLKQWKLKAKLNKGACSLIVKL